MLFFFFEKAEVSCSLGRYCYSMNFKEENVHNGVLKRTLYLKRTFKMTKKMLLLKYHLKRNRITTIRQRLNLYL